MEIRQLDENICGISRQQYEQRNKAEDLTAEEAELLQLEEKAEQQRKAAHDEGDFDKADKFQKEMWAHQKARSRLGGKKAVAESAVAAHQEEQVAVNKDLDKAVEARELALWRTKNLRRLIAVANEEIRRLNLTEFERQEEDRLKAEEEALKQASIRAEQERVRAHEENQQDQKDELRRMRGAKQSASELARQAGISMQEYHRLCGVVDAMAPREARRTLQLCERNVKRNCGKAPGLVGDLTAQKALLRLQGFKYTPDGVKFLSVVLSKSSNNK